MTLTAWIAIAVILVTVYCLIKRFETRLVLFTAGLFLCCIAMKPMAALDQFAKSMANASLIMAICSSMGFAYVVTTTGCDKNLVKFLAAPLNKLGILLIPATTIITSFINVAIPSASRRHPTGRSRRRCPDGHFRLQHFSGNEPQQCCCQNCQYGHDGLN